VVTKNTLWTLEFEPTYLLLHSILDTPFFLYQILLSFGRVQREWHHIPLVSWQTLHISKSAVGVESFFHRENTHWWRMNQQW
jgi:hypothetical protein